MQKLGFGVIGIVLVAIIYYFTTGSAQITEEMKMRVNTELTMIEQNGFVIEEREIKAKKEHFVLSFDDPEKMMKFFKQQGSEIALEDVQSLKGMKIGVDLQYLNDTYSALSVDMYPLNLPLSITDTKDLEEADKALIKQLNDMLKRKALLVHVDFNKLLSSFKGYVKDIHETFKTETQIKMDLEGATFEGTIKEDRIHTLSQSIKNIRLNAEDELDIIFGNVKTNYTLNGKSIYDSTSSYTLESIKLSGKKEKNTYSFTANTIKGSNETSVENDLASNKIKLSVSDIEIKDNAQKTKLMHTTFTFNVGNLDMNILKKLEEADVTKEEEINKLVQALISKGITMEIPLFEVKKLEYLEKKIDGFSLTSSFQVNKSANLAQIQANPFAALSAVNTKTKLTLSDALFTIIAQDPRAMMLAMIIQPKVVNGKKVYELELKDGKLTVNGQGML